ncbi:hypothetical protein KDAU_35270 [Dictyobacter aurantiacus]|uniref:Uncharacterized protein n=1 Tax=Dictyobacter aurantiacus TaxID=1936993 RepID=A0A401ZHM4_9CHLR|nr:hypothetical protein KDAU_35270 [Dictyobacter aurantiacus]
MAGEALFSEIVHQDWATSQLFSTKALAYQPHQQGTAYNVRTTAFLSVYS